MRRAPGKPRTSKKRKVLKGMAFAGAAIGGGFALGRSKKVASGIAQLRKSVSSNPRVVNATKKAKDSKFGQSVMNTGKRVASKAQEVTGKAKETFGPKLATFKDNAKKRFGGVKDRFNAYRQKRKG